MIRLAAVVAIVLVTVVVGCALKPVITPGGRIGYNLSCWVDDKQDCYAQAKRLCPNGYYGVLSSEIRKEIIVFGDLTRAPVTTLELFVECH